MQTLSNMNILFDAMRDAIISRKWRETELLSERLRGLLLDISQNGSISEAASAARRTMAHRAAMAPLLDIQDEKAREVSAVLRYDSGLATIIGRRVQ